MTGITADELKILAQWDTPTICNALEIVLPERRGHGFTVAPFSCLDPALPPMVGFARTAKIRAAAPDLSAPTIVVIEDVDPKPGVGAFWGEVHTAVHKGLGALGVVTNGSYRDIPDSAPGFQVLGGMVGPSHAFVRPVDFNCPVSVHGMEVVHDDIVHGDRHGAVVVPAEAVGRIADAVDLISRKEAHILEAANAADFDIEKLKQAIGASADIH
jgi:regulator of RNase E activity RraA